MRKTIGVLALQGAFLEHEKMLQRLGCETRELRNAADLRAPIDGLILPGGESTVQGKLLRETGMFDTIRSWIVGGMPVLATCAGLILLAEELEGDETRYFATLPVRVKRNAYGRQLGSFVAEEEVRGIGRMEMHFIRAPYIEKAAPEVEILSTTGGHIVAVQYRYQIACAFHPEVTADTRLHARFLSLCEAYALSMQKAG